MGDDYDVTALCPDWRMGIPVMDLINPGTQGPSLIVCDYNGCGYEFQLATIGYSLVVGSALITGAQFDFTLVAKTGESVPVRIMAVVIKWFVMDIMAALGLVNTGI